MNRSTKRQRGRAVPAPTTLPTNLTDDSRLSRPQSALWLTKNGASVSAQRLAIMASSGEGPPYCILFGRAVYLVADLRAWLAKLTAVTFTSAADRFEHQRRVKRQRCKDDVSERDNRIPTSANNPSNFLQEQSLPLDDSGSSPSTSPVPVHGGVQ
jgi:hypothetical protein